MNTVHDPKLWRRSLAVAYCSSALLSCFGCTSYFRTGEISYDELKQKNQEKQEEREMWLKPGTVFYSR